MSRLMIAAAAIAGLSIADCASSQEESLIYSVLRHERSNQCVPMPNFPAIREVRDNELQYVAPTPTAPYTSKAFGPLVGYGQMLGDHDADGNYWEPQLFEDPNFPGGIDAVLQPRGRAHRNQNMRGVFISPARVVNHAMGAPYPFRPGDVARFLPPAGPWPVLEHFITEAQVALAFGLVGPVNVDAIAFDTDQQLGGIYLSFEDQEPVPGGGVINDGDLLRIPINAIGLVLSPYDGAPLVAAVAPGSGQVVAVETPQVDGWIANANAADAAGAQVLNVFDLDGLTLAPQPGYFGPFLIRHLWLSCEDSNGGAGVVSTWAGGSIPFLGGVALASNPPAPTTGLQVGLVTAPVVGSLNGLSRLDRLACHFVTDAMPPIGGVTFMEIGGATGLPALLLFGGAPDAIAPDPSAPVLNPCFPDVYAILAWAWLPAIPGCMSWPIVLPPVPGFHLTVQIVEFPGIGLFRLSTPTVFDL